MVTFLELKTTEIGLVGEKGGKLGWGLELAIDLHLLFLARYGRGGLIFFLA